MGLQLGQDQRQGCLAGVLGASPRDIREGTVVKHRLQAAQVLESKDIPSHESHPAHFCKNVMKATTSGEGHGSHFHTGPDCMAAIIQMCHNVDPLPKAPSGCPVCGGALVLQGPG